MNVVPMRGGHRQYFVSGELRKVYWLLCTINIGNRTLKSWRNKTLESGHLNLKVIVPMKHGDGSVMWKYGAS